MGFAVQYFLPYQTDVLGFAIGAVLLYFSMADELRYLDEESGLYNQGFLTCCFDRSLAEKNGARSALILEADGDLPSCFEILHDTLHREHDVIRIEEKKFLMFSRNDSRSAVQLLSTNVEEAVEKHNAEHPEKAVRMTVHCRMRTGEEDSFSFLRSVVEDKDAGDPVRGVVSMISELDRLDEELKLAADIQFNMLPMNFPPFPDRTEFELYASMKPAKEVGGDFYDFFLIDPDHLALVIADVSGKGIPAALFMMVSKTLIKNQLMSGCDPATALEHVNLQLCERNSSMMFVTVWLAVVEISTGKGTACNAGHENPALRRSGGDFEMFKYKHGMVAGVNKNAKFQNRDFELHPGDCVFVYTDGVPEANNAAGEMFGETRLLAALNQDPDAAPDALIRRVHESGDRFAGGADQFDDITMLCMKYYGMQGNDRS
jgi:sigma-B regulation protein RsbU (phosphoserine phosphatase)